MSSITFTRTKPLHVSVLERGFTLIELLVVISVIGILAALLITNLVGIRGRAGDTQIKADLKSLQTALRIYYNDFQKYPDASGGNIMGCGVAGTSACSQGDTFSAGASNTIYMGELPEGYTYYSDGADGFLLISTLDNVSDEDLVNSQAKCDPDGRVYFTGTLAATDYVVCEF